MRDPTLFADDTSLFYSNACIKQLETDINSDLIKVSDWLASNKLILNVSKSNFIVFNQGKHHFKLDIKLDNDPLIQKDCVKYLGIFIDSKLLWANHIDHVKKKLSSGLAIIFKLKLMNKSLRAMYFKGKDDEIKPE